MVKTHSLTSMLPKKVFADEKLRIGKMADTSAHVNE